MAEAAQVYLGGTGLYLAGAVVEVAEPVQNRLKELFKEPCRGAVDAINIACCLTFEAAAGMPIPFITGDARRRDAAAQMKLHVVWTG